MGLAEIIIISLGLSADAFAVALGNGLCGVMKPPENIFNAFVFGLFQGVMPVLGYALGQSFSGYVTAYDHVIALVLLSFIGIKMLKETNEETENLTSINCGTIIVQGFATSIDAMAVGVSLSATGNTILVPSAVIAFVTFVCSLAGIVLGKKCGAGLGKTAKTAGGILLLLIGLKIFIQDVFF